MSEQGTRVAALYVDAHGMVSARGNAMSRVPGTFKTPPLELRRDRSRFATTAETLLLDAGALHAERWTLGACTIMLAREPYTVGHGYLEHRWHLSISHPDRYPTWDEIKTAVYRLCDGVTMAQVLGPVGPGEWVNIADNCFHLYEIRDPIWVRAGGIPAVTAGGTP